MGTIVFLSIIIAFNFYAKKKVRSSGNFYTAYNANYFGGFWYAFIALIYEAIKIVSFDTYLQIKSYPFFAFMSAVYLYSLVLWILGLPDYFDIKKGRKIFIVKHVFSTV